MVLLIESPYRVRSPGVVGAAASDPLWFRVFVILGLLALAVGHVGNAAMWWKYRSWPFLDSERRSAHIAGGVACCVLAVIVWVQA